MNRLTTWIGMVVLVMTTGAAQATLVAGWDFSQFRGTGIPSIDGVTNTTTLPANYSGLDPTFNAGAESAAFGTATFSGDIVPVAGSLGANLDGTVEVFGQNEFDSRTVLAFEGQVFQQLLSMTTESTGEIEFEATMGPSGGGDWWLSFAGKTLSGTSTVTVDFSTDGSSFSPLGSFQLDDDPSYPEGRKYVLVLDSNMATSGYVRLGLDASTGQPLIDNVAINVPEPGATTLLVSGLVGLAALARRRG